jgi:dihydroflavonol-4-reductase
LLLIAGISGLIGRLRGQPPALRATDLKRLQRPLRWDSQKAERELGVKFRPLEETLADTVGWFRSGADQRPTSALPLIKEA